MNTSHEKQQPDARTEPPDAQTEQPGARTEQRGVQTGSRRGRRPPLVPEGRQLQVMSILWRRGSATVAEVQCELNDLWEPEIAYNTVLTYLRTLRRGRWVQVMPAGKAHRYFPAVSPDYVRRLEIERIADLLFGGSREALLTHLLMDKGTPRRLVERLRGVLERRLADGLPQRTVGSTRCEGKSAVR